MVVAQRARGAVRPPCPHHPGSRVRLDVYVHSAWSEAHLRETALRRYPADGPATVEPEATFIAPSTSSSSSSAPMPAPSSMPISSDIEWRVVRSGISRRKNEATKAIVPLASGAPKSTDPTAVGESSDDVASVSYTHLTLTTN